MAGRPTIWTRPVRAVRRLLIRPHHDVHVAIWVWGGLALACLIAGVMVSNNPGRSDAYIEVRNWLTIWRSGVNVYEQRALLVDYPPHALVFMSPLLWFPSVGGEFWFALFNVVVCAITAWTIVSLTSGYAAVPLSRTERLAYALMLLVWSPTRVGIWNGQTSPALILCCCLALRMSQWSPVVAGTLLAIGLSKPHVAFGFVLLAAFCRMWKMLSVAVVAAVAAAFAYTLTVSRAPVDVFNQYLANLFDVYGGPTFLRAEVDLRPFFTDLIPDYNVAESIYLAWASVLGAYLLWLAWRGRNIPDAGVWVMAAGMMWALSVFPFRRYGMLLIAPTVLMMLWQPRLSEWRLTLVGVLIFVIAADLPFLVRHALVTYGPASAAKYAFLTHYFNRVVTVICLVTAFRTLARISARPAAVPIATS